MSQFNTNMRESVLVSELTPQEVGSILAKKCLFDGQVKNYCSVAEFSVYLGGMLPLKHAIYGLFYPAMSQLSNNFTDKDRKDLCLAVGLNYGYMMSIMNELMTAQRELIQHAMSVLQLGQVVPVSDNHPLHNANFGFNPQQAEIYWNDYYKTLVE